MGFVSVFLVLLGLLMLVKPSIVWFLTESWKTNDAAGPSDLYIISTRFGGVVVTLAGIGGVIGFLIV